MNKEEIRTVLESMARRYFPNLKFQFKGFYRKDSPEIAVKSGQMGILLNENSSNIKRDQLERALVHELQHVQDTQDIGWNDNNESQYVLGFIFHPKFKDLYERLEEYYEQKLKEGARLGLEMSPLPERFDAATSLRTKNNYGSPSEILARLKGYEHYLTQVEEGVEVETLPYESIEVFKEEDLKFLDLEYRKELTKELKLENPEIFESKVGEKVVVEESDLPKPGIS
jgi:hypothetical protein